MLRAKVRVSLSTDAGIHPTKPHDGLTATAAQACGVGDRKGRVGPGYDADLIAVAGNPLHDITTVVNVREVFRAGCLTR